MNENFRQKWIKLINTATEQKCRIFLERMRNIKKLQAHRNEVKFEPFTSEQKFVYKLLKDRLEVLAAETNKNLNVIRLPRAEMSDMNWKTLKQEKELDEEIGKRSYRFAKKGYK
jgi:hypothetical protein